MRLTIGLFAENNWLRNENVSILFNGVAEACEKHDVNLVRFGYFNANELLRIESQHTLIMDLIEQFQLDGLLFIGWSWAVQGENLAALRKKANAPVVSIGKILDGIPGNFFYGGLYLEELLLHLIREHRYQRIAYLCPWTYDARNDVYRETLQTHGLFEPDLMVSETLLKGIGMYERAQKGVSILLDERKAKFDAIIAATAEEAYTVQTILKKRGYRIPEDMAVCSYEDNQLMRFASPNITSICFPTKQLSCNGAEKLIEWIRTGHTDAETSVPGTIEYRQSCGCRMDRSLPELKEEVELLTLKNEEKEVYFRQIEEVGKMIASSYDKAHLFDVLSAGLEKLNISNCYMFGYAPDSRSFADCTLDFQYTNTKRDDLYGATPFRSMKTACFPDNRRITYMAELLHVGDDYYGFILLEADKLDLRIYLSMVANLSTVIKGIHLIARLSDLAHHDQLTHLYNRSSFQEHLSMLCEGDRPFSLMYADIDGFKPVNDTYGHDVGDILLVQIAERLRRILKDKAIMRENYPETREREFIYRLGGDEFTAILIPTDNRSLYDIGNELLDAFNCPFIIDGHYIRIGLSIGFSKFPTDAKDYKMLVKNADTAMYKAKELKNTVMIYDGRS